LIPATATTYAWMTRMARRISVSSGLPSQPAKAAPCVRDLLGHARHPAHVATEAGI